MVGANPNFPLADVRAGILFAAKMAAPNDPTMIPTFHWDPVVTVADADDAGQPWFFNGTVTPTSTAAIDDLALDTVVAAVERGEEGPEGTRIGMFRGQKVTLTVVDTVKRQIEEHGAGRFADSVIIGSTVYRIEEIPKPDSIFNFDVWTIHAYADSPGKAP